MYKYRLPKTTLLFFYSIILIFIIGLLNPNHANAQEEVALGVFPPIIQIDATPPTSVKTPISIQNFSTDPIDVSIVLKPFKSSDTNNGTVFYLPDNTGFGGDDPQISNHIQIMDEDHVVTQLTLAPQQEKALTLHVGLPEGEPPSDYYFSIVFIANNSLPDTGSTAVTTGGVATNVLLSVGPKKKASGFIKNFHGPLFVDHGPISFSLLMHNDSQFFISPKGTVVIKNMFGQIIGKLKLLPVNILSRSDRYVPDDQSASQDSLVWPEKALFGPYSVSLNVALSEEGPVFSKTIYFFAFPTQFIIGLIVVILLTVGIIFRIHEQLRLKQGS